MYHITILGSTNKTGGQKNKSSCPRGANVPVEKENNKKTKNTIRAIKKKNKETEVDGKCHW